MGEEHENVATPETTTPSKKKEPKMIGKIRRSYLVALIIVVVLAVAGGGFYAWHETPEFCDAICHNPQDPYNPTYYAEPGEAAVDKWGNEVADASGMLSAVHRAKVDATCLSCHKPTMQEQVSEGIQWLTGDFYNPLSERNLDDLMRWLEKDGTEFCLTSGCHNYDTSFLTKMTASYERNPHSWHHIEYDCSDCHKAHRASIMVCTQCHDDAEVPAGWLTYEESQNLETVYGQFADEQ